MSELEGAEAVEYAQQRLKEVRVDPDKWEVEYVDERTGDKWLMDYPHAELQGGGSPRLRRVS
jgi:Immunity protein 27